MNGYLAYWNKLQQTFSEPVLVYQERTELKFSNQAQKLITSID